MSNETPAGEPFEANDALREVQSMWLTLANAFRDYVSEPGDWVEDSKDADRAIQMAARAEACFWRATGDEMHIETRLFIPEAQRDKEA